MIIIGSISTNFVSAFNLLYICLSDILKQQMKSRAICHKAVNSVGFTAKQCRIEASLRNENPLNSLH